MNLYLQMGSNNFQETRHNESLLSRPVSGDRVAAYERDVAEVLLAISRIPCRSDITFMVPYEGVVVPFVEWQRSANRYYFMRQKRLACPVRCMYLCYGKHKETSARYTVKILNIKDHETETLTQDDIQGMFLMHNEYMLLNRLKDKAGVYRVHDYYKELYSEEKFDENRVLIYTGRTRVRVCLLLDYVAPNNINPRCELDNLQHYILKRKVLTELEATIILREILLVVKILHTNNVVHRNLKLNNVRIDKNTRKATLINFGYGQHLPSKATLISDQRGSPAYISPDVLSGKPYSPEPSEMWSLGVSYYVMLMGEFPFYHTNSKEFFDKIRHGTYYIRLSGIQRFETLELIKGLLAYNPEARIKIDDAIALTSKIINGLNSVTNERMQVVPDLESSEDIAPKKPDEHRWTIVQPSDRYTLRQDPGSQIPILNLSQDGQRVDSITMLHIRSSIGTIPIDVLARQPFASGIFTGDPYLSKTEPPKVDQVVPEFQVDDENEPKPTSEAIPIKPSTSDPKSEPVAPKRRRILRSNSSIKNVNIRSLLN